MALALNKINMALASKPKPSVQHRKRQAGHHRHSKDYLKTYWPYLPMLMTVAVGLMINSIWSAQGHVLGASSDFSSSSLLSDTNAMRRDNSEAALTLDSRLSAAAQAKADDMAVNNYWSHDSPDGKTPWSFISDAGYDYAVAGENLAYGFAGADATVVGWMNSTEHRANILDNNYQNVGFGVATSRNFQNKGPETIVVAEYAAPVPAAANITFTVPNSSTPVPTGSSQPAQSELAAQPVSRVQLLTGGQAAWSALAVSALAGAALAVLIVRHGRYWRRMLASGEAFLAHHPVLDVLMAFVATFGYILTRPGGIIR